MTQNPSSSAPSPYFATMPTGTGPGQMPPNLPPPAPLPHLELSPFQRFFLWMAKTDAKAIAHCTPEALMGQTTLGAMVLLTGLLALGSSTFTVSTMVGNGWSPAYLVPPVYASAIMLFDRELVGFVPDLEDTGLKKFVKMLPRFFFATVLGFAIAIPVELEVFKGGIKDQINKQVKFEGDERLKMEGTTREETALGTDVQEARQAEKTANDDLRKVNEELTRLNADLAKAETEEKPTRAIKTLIASALQDKKRYQATIAGKQKLIDDQSGKRTDQNAKSDQKLAAQDKANQARTDALNSDLLTRYLAITDVCNAKPGAFFLKWLLTTIFMLLELFPMILKLFSKYNEYHAYLNARRAINIQKCHVLGNIAIDDIARSPEHAVMYGEYTDMLQTKAEDAAGTV
jgi:hypothetical protein